MPDCARRVRAASKGLRVRVPGLKTKTPAGSWRYKILPIVIYTPKVTICQAPKWELREKGPRPSRLVGLGRLRSVGAPGGWSAC